MEIYDFRFGFPQDDDPSRRIFKGRISLSNDELKSCFDNVVERIIDSCLTSLIEQKTKVI
jgi:hypothetical protein